MSAIESWFKYILGFSSGADVKQALLDDKISMLSVIFDRSCNLQCKHCVYQPESNLVCDNFLEIVVNIARQLPENSLLVHEGRIFKPWHVNVLSKVRKVRPDIKIGIIENGSYRSYEKSFDSFGFDWIDVSLDGMRKTHGLQRCSDRSFDVVVSGLRHAKKNCKEVTALMTLSKINYKDAFNVADFVLKNNLADEVHFTPTIPVRAGQNSLELFSKELAHVYRQLLKAATLYGNKICLKFFRAEDVCNLLNELNIRVNPLDLMAGKGAMYFPLKLGFYYHPASLWPQESFLIDTDGAYRCAFAQKYKLVELKNHKEYTISKLDQNSNLDDMYNKGACHWWKHFGEDALRKEKELLQNVLKGS